MFGFSVLSVLLVVFYWVPAPPHFDNNARGTIEDVVDGLVQIGGYFLFFLRGQFFRLVNRSAGAQACDCNRDGFGFYPNGSYGSYDFYKFVKVPGRFPGGASTSPATYKFLYVF